MCPCYPMVSNGVISLKITKKNLLRLIYKILDHVTIALMRINLDYVKYILLQAKTDIRQVLIHAEALL